MIGAHKNTSAQLNAHVYQSRLNSITIPIKTFGILCWSNLNFNLHYYILNRIFWTLQVKRSTGEDLPSVFWFLNGETSNKWTSFKPSVEVCFVKKIWEEKRERSCSPLNKHYPLNDKISSRNEQFDLLLHYILLVSKSNTPE